MKYFFATLMLLVPALSSASAVGGYFEGGLISTSYEETFDGGGVELESGVGVAISGGIRFSPGLMARLSYAYSEHDGGEIYEQGFGSATFNEEVQLTETRLGFYYAPPNKGVAGFVVGGGYERITLDVPDVLNDEQVTDGLFVEGTLLLKAGPIVTFNLGATLLALENEDGDDAGGAELKAGAVFHAGPVDIGLTYRRVALTVDYDDGTESEPEYGEAKLTIGGRWGYPN